MKRLTRLSSDPTYLQRYISIRDRKHLNVRNQLIAAHTSIERQYEAFETASDANTLGALVAHPMCAAISDALRACYNSATQPLNLLKEAIKASQPPRQLKYCPMCGTTLHSTFDHYLPAVRFPEFAVHPLNLVPCCATCNSTKDDDWLAGAGQRQYLHAFLDELPNVRFVSATLHESDGYTGVGSTFQLVQPADVDAILWALIESHFRKLHLLERYTELSNDEISEIVSSCRIHLEAGGSNVRQYLGLQAQDLECTHGLNHWRAVLMRTMAGHANLQAWIEAGNSVPA
jgi:5-methylcytosine-specific restriction endonuclease McrA